MKKVIYLVTTGAISTTLFFGCCGLNEKFGLDDDNIVEEITEAVIEHQLGIDVDLTPFSQE